MTVRTFFCFFLLWTILISMGAAQDSEPAATQASLAAADALHDAGKLDDAARIYESLLNGDPNLWHARAELMRVRLRQQRTDDAYELGKAGLALPAHTAELLAAMGDVQFRRGEMVDAEQNYLHAKRVNPREMHAYLGLARLYGAYSLHRRAYDQLKAAHEIAPSDLEVEREWFRMLPRRERLQAIKDYLAAPHPDDHRENTWLEQYAAFLSATVNKPAHACRLVSTVERTQTPLVLLLLDASHLRGYGLHVKLNDRASNLMLDTGASGIAIGRKAAERAGLERISHISIGGIGDKGLQSGYTAVARKIRIGELEFEDCVVEVSDRTSLAEEDGLIGADVFSSYLIDLDGPGKMMRLSPLPKRPEDTTVATALNTDEDDADEDEDATKQPKTNREPLLPKDRYVAPEMASWTKVFRFGHQLLIPTHVNDLPSMLFAIDTGSQLNLISTTAARKATKVHRDDYMTVTGVNGAVDKVYSADKVKLHFSHLAQQNEDIVTLDLSGLSKDVGTEVSGLLGFALLNLLELKLDYRDGLVDFSYDTKRLPPPLGR
jgi:tetratricopeptide (TPR) repeat protein